MKTVFFRIVPAALCLSLICSFAQADDVTMLLESIEKNYTEKKYAKALEDLEWAKKGIVNQHLSSMKSLFPDEIDGMKGIDAEGGAVLGVHGVSKHYKDANGNKSVVVSFVSGSTSATKGLGALMEMAASLGALEAGTSSKLVIEKGYRGQFVPEGKNGGTLSFSLSGGKMVTIETNGYGGATMAQKVAGMLDLAKIEAAF